MSIAEQGDKDRRFYVYALIDPRSGKPFYVGKGQGNRLHAHVRDARNGKVSGLKKHTHIRCMLAEGVTPDARILKGNLTGREAITLERQLIAKGRKLGVLVNGRDEGRHPVDKKIQELRDGIEEMQRVLDCGPSKDEWLKIKPRDCSPHWYEEVNNMLSETIAFCKEHIKVLECRTN